MTIALIKYRQQPLRSLYLAYSIVCVLLFHAPWWTITSLPGLRPRASWPFSKSFKLKLTRYLIHLGGVVGPLRRIPNHTTIDRSKLKPHHFAEWIEPINISLIQGEVKDFATKANVKPIRIPGYWQHHKGETVTSVVPAGKDEKVLYMLHGGAYVAESASPGNVTQNITRGLLKHIPKAKLERALSVEYRLSKGVPLYKPENSFPAALIDALSGYFYLTNVIGFEPKNVTVVGDSAGGHLALTLVRYLKTTHIESLQPPGGLVLLSPWVDMGPSHVGPNSSLGRFASSDYLGNVNTPNMGYPVWAFTYPFPDKETLVKQNLYFSTASKDTPNSIVNGLFADFPRTFISGGGAEQLVDSIRTLHGRIKEDMGDKVTYLEAKDAFHDFLAIEWAEPERSETLDAISEWFQAL